MSQLYRITAQHFCAGFVLGQTYAPIIAYMAEWPLDKIIAYCKRKGWELEQVKKSQAVVYADGASTRDWRGGWGATVKYDGWWYDMSGGEYDTTNNRMELTAVIEALNWLPVPCRVIVYCDSQYVIKGITEYIEAWKFCGWRTGGNKPVKNIDLWKELEKIAARHEVVWQWVKGHSGIPGNEAADRLAGAAVPPKKTSIGGSHGGEGDSARATDDALAGRLQRTVRRQERGG